MFPYLVVALTRQSQRGDRRAQYFARERGLSCFLEVGADISGGKRERKRESTVRAHSKKQIDLFSRAKYWHAVHVRLHVVNATTRKGNVQNSAPFFAYLKDFKLRICPDLPISPDADGADTSRARYRRRLSVRSSKLSRTSVVGSLPPPERSAR